MGVLYVIATPIGNLEDISLRALRVLKDVTLIAAEDTRKTRKLLTAYDIKTPLTSYFEHSTSSKLGGILGRLEIGDVAIVSEAGVPGISDPGYELVKAAITHGIPVVPVPGASAAVTALSISGLPTDRFLFLGFLPAKGGPRRSVLEDIQAEKSTLLLYEAPHRIIDALTDILGILGDRHLAVCRELTKLHEEVFRGTVSQALEHFTRPRGEFTLVIEGNKGPADTYPVERLDAMLKELRRAGKTAREATTELAQQTGLSKKEIYHLWLKQKRT